MAAPEPLPGDTHAKALAINLDHAAYGTFAEIGAGQEVARWFLTVGGASGTVAQTISAYDKTFSDDTYGTGTRYVSRDRVLAMLDREYQLLVDRLGATRGGTTRFFAFADTASARNFHGDNLQHAWVGVRSQTAPGAEPSDVLLHVNLMAPTARLQQDALGVLGVNLLDAVLYRRDSAERFLGALWDGLRADRLEIDVVELRGPAFAGVDARSWNIQLVRRGMAHAIAFGLDGAVVEPAGVFHKRPLIVDRGKFVEVEPFHEQMLAASERQLRAEGVPLGRDPLHLLEITLDPALGGDPVSDAEVLSRVDHLMRLGTVAVTDFPEVYRLAEYLRRYTTEPVRYALGVSLMARILEDRFYDELPGRLLEGLGRLLDEGVKLYAYPMPRAAVEAALGAHAGRFRMSADADGLVTADDLIPEPPVDHLYRYLRSAGWVIPVGPH